MSNVERIQSAESKVADVQQALSLVQSGLETAETIAVATEEAKRRSGKLVKVVIVVTVVAIVAGIVARRRRREPAEPDDR